MTQKAAAALDAFQYACNRRMATANKANDPKEPLFHYTNEKALFSILDSGQFWFTSIYYMDDPEELNFGFDVACEMFKEASQRTRGLEHNFCGALGVDGDREKIRSMIECYSVSFGLRDVSKQWIKYAQAGTGVALGLAPEFFWPAPFEDPDNPKPEEEIYYGKVSYGLEDGRARHRPVVDAALVLIEQVLRRGWVSSSQEAGAFCAHLAASMYSEILWNCITTKKSCWDYQNEMRLLARNFLKDPKLPIVKGEKGPRVELNQPRLKQSVVEVMVGPKADADALQRVRDGLATRGLGQVLVTHGKPE